jgi:uncharacterized protein YndB with AHSA1/START domain
MEKETTMTIDTSTGFTLVRTFRASPEQIWQAWTDADSAARWWHPLQMHTPRDSVQIDARVSGRYTYTMVPDAPAGDVPADDAALGAAPAEGIVTAGTYRVVEPHRRLEFTWGFPDDDADESPLVTIALEPVDDVTRMTFQLLGVAGVEGDGSYYDGWEQALDSLGEYLGESRGVEAGPVESYPAETGGTFEVRVTREFPVPVALAYAAWTEEEGVRAWWGPTGFTCPYAEMDVRPGGVSLVAMRAPAEYGGGDIFNTWNYAHVEPLARLEYVMRFATADGETLTPEQVGIPDGVPHGVPHVVTFEPVPGGSRVTVVESGYTTRQARDMSQSGMDECLDKLERLLQGVAA